ncbi:MAG: photosystem II assembly protein Psb35 [Aulosira sp. ZfuVER01]|nr:hypothetical protein [Aulosira sp. ZfuVER01]MDZ7998884.1 hypothetical protein [Aulosira sp. DedVER01a]MDZ8053624.1 hypothetical protein [Aulosira sp. ZfuCHP01]
MMNIAFSYLLTQTSVAAESSSSYSIALTTVLIVGFVAAAIIGSIAWYNSKRPVGWEDKERPDFVPDVDQ